MYIIHIYYTYILYIYIIHIYYTYILYIYDFHWISMNFLYWRVLSVSSPFIFRIAPSGLQAGSQTGQGQLGHWTRLGLRWTQHANGLALARHVEMPTAGMVFSNVEYHLNVIRTSYEYHMNQIFGYIWIIWDLCPHRCKVISTFTHFALFVVPLRFRTPRHCCPIPLTVKMIQDANGLPMLY